MPRAGSLGRAAAAGALAWLTAGCATPNVAFNPRADFSSIRRVAVVSFGGPQGDLAADLLTQSLVAHGAEVVERAQLSAVLREQNLGASGALDPSTIKQIGKILGVDALFVGTVSHSMPAQSYLVASSPQVVIDPVTPIAGSNVASRGAVLGIPDSQLVTTAASAAVVARLVDVGTGSILWSASMTYEGFDTQSAMEGITEAFAHSLVPVWPALAVLKKP